MDTMENDSIIDDSIVDLLPPNIIDVIDLTKESPRSARPSRSHQRNIPSEDIPSSQNITGSLDRTRVFLPPIVLGNKHYTQTKDPKKKERTPHATTSDEVLTLDDTIEESKICYTVESDNRNSVALTCPICFETLSSKLKPMTTRCGHLFCTECLQASIVTFKKCPTCKAAITLKSCTRLYL